jgi:diacylglycerol O-acyltransferase
VALMPVSDAMFMLPESREQPMHVGSLQIFELPADAGPLWLRELFERCVSVSDVSPTFRRRPTRSLATLNQWAWATEDDIDLGHHVRHSALPGPGRVRELLELTSRLHATLLDRHRPLWEAHLIEGLEGDRFAVYTKIHHAMMDGVSALRLLQRSLSTDAEETATPVPWAARPRRAGRVTGAAGGALGLPGMAGRAAADLLGMAPVTLKLLDRAVRGVGMTLPVTAPLTLFNTPVSSARRFAADSWSIEQIRGVAKAADATINDVVLAMCSGALRRYLLDLSALPDTSLTAMTPVSLRPKDTGSNGSGGADAPGSGGGESEDDQSDGDGGNAVGAILCTLGTDLADPAERLAAITASTRAGKASLAGLSQTQITLLSLAVMGPALLAGLPGIGSRLPPAFNLIISNLPGPTAPLYWSGAKLQGLYPLSIPFTGQALNITVTSYDGEMQFGLTGARRNVPHLQRLLGHLDTELVALTDAVA